MNGQTEGSTQKLIRIGFAETPLHLPLKNNEFWIAVSTELRSSGWLKLGTKNEITFEFRLNGVEKFRVAETTQRMWYIELRWVSTELRSSGWLKQGIRRN